MILKEFAGFLKREKYYVLLFLVMVAAYMGLSILGKKFSPVENKSISQELAQFREAEKKLEKDLPESKVLIEKYMREHPVYAFSFQLFSVLFALVMLCGIVIDGLLIMRPAFRYKFDIHAPPGKTQWRVSMLFKVVVLTLLGLLLSAMALNMVHLYLLPDMSMNLFLLLETTFLEVLCFLFMIYIIQEHGGSWRDIGFRLPSGNVFAEIKAGVLTYMAILPVFIGIVLVLIFISNLLKYEPPAHPLVDVFLQEEKRSPRLIIYSIFMATLMGPFFEEVFFRGFCYPALKSRWGMKWAMIVTAAFFAFIHHSEFTLIPIFILGLGLAYLYEKRQCIIAPLTLHIVHNSVFMAYFFLAKQIIQQE